MHHKKSTRLKGDKRPSMVEGHCKRCSGLVVGQSMSLGAILCLDKSLSLCDGEVFLFFAVALGLVANWLLLHLFSCLLQGFQESEQKKMYYNTTSDLLLISTFVYKAIII